MWYVGPSLHISAKLFTGALLIAWLEVSFHLNFGSHKSGYDRPDMTIAVYWDFKQEQNKQNKRVIMVIH